MDKQELIDDLLFQLERRENDFPIIDKDGKVLFPVLSKSGIRTEWIEPVATHYRFGRGGMMESYTEPKGLKGYRGICVEINDHGNVTVWDCFKNGSRKELASRV